MLSFLVASMSVLSVAGKANYAHIDMKTAKERAASLVNEMTLEEKISLMSGKLGTYTGNIPGIERLKIPEVSMQDGPQGFRTMEPRTGPPGSSTAWPSVLSAGASWDEELMYRWGVAMGTEFKGKGANIQLGPGVGFARVPTAGRNFEYLPGEDPCLGATLVKPLIQGIQSQGVMANAKHYVNNEIETHRQTVSANVEERIRYELYYPPFQAAIDAGVLSVMCAYNRVNGVHACENPETLSQLRGMGFEGWVMSDWMATHSTAESLLAGLDQELPLGLHYNSASLNKQLDANAINTTNIDMAVTHYLTSVIGIGLMDEDKARVEPVVEPDPNAIVTTDEHLQLAREIAAKSAVLLENRNQLLPIDRMNSEYRKYVVIGDNSTIAGGGSGSVSPSEVVTHSMGIQSAYDELEDSDVSIIYNDGLDLEQAMALVEDADVVIVVVGVTSCEGSDRETLSLGDQQNTLVSSIAAMNCVQEKGNMVVSVLTPGASLLPWAPDVPGAILVNWLPGQEMGNGFADVIFGKVNPSGRLSVTFPNMDNEIEFSESQYPGIGIPPEATYSEGLLVGYRWYDAKKVKPLYPFGYGLSYTTFEINNLKIQQMTNKTAIDADYSEILITLTVDINNIGEYDGDEIIQTYVQYPEIANEPVHQLRHFRKIFVKKNDIQTVEISLTKRDLSIWDSERHEWKMFYSDDYKYTIHIGSSSRNLVLNTTVSF